jgi:predicted DNA-binding protein
VNTLKVILQGVTLMGRTQRELMRLQVDVSEEIKSRLKIYSVTAGTTMSEVVEKALKEYLDRVESAKGKK